MTTSQQSLSKCRPWQSVFCALDGNDGGGKTTAAQYLFRYLTESMRYETRLTREPGGTELAMKLREDIMFNELMKDASHTVQALVIAAARRDHVERVIAPALARGEIVICDRYTLSTRIYQENADKLNEIISIGSMGIQPHMSLIFDVSYENARDRIMARAAASQQKSNWLDSIDKETFDRRRNILLEYAEDNPLSVFVIDANKTQEEVNRQVHTWMSDVLLPVILKRSSAYEIVHPTAKEGVE